jgi:hypothetical protein
MKKFLIALLGIILFFSTLISCVSISDTDSSNDLSNDVPNTTTINFFENTTTPDTNSKDPEPTGLTYELKNLDGKYYMTVHFKAYSESPEFLGMLAPAVSFRNSTLKAAKSRRKTPGNTAHFRWPEPSAVSTMI